MNMDQARQLIGNQDSVSLRNMIRALTILPALNTPADYERLAAARFILKTRNKALKSAINKDVKIG